MRGLRGFAALVFLALISGCVTRGGEEEAAVAPPVELEFSPVCYVSPIQLERGRYGNLFAADSYAVWVGDDMAALKRAHDEESGEKVDPVLAAASSRLNENFLIFECHLASAFADMSIGYDAVGLRNADVYLLTAAGRAVRPVQTILAGPIEESQQGALKRFERVNLVIFPRKDLATGSPVVDPMDPGVRLVVEAVRTTFYFEWESGLNTVPPAGPTVQDRLRAVQMGFNEVYRKILEGAHVFD